MDTVNRFAEFMKPIFENISNNSYIRAIRDGYDSCVPVLLFAALFVLAANTTEMAGVALSADTKSQVWRVYDYSMGVLSLLMAITVSRSLTDSFNNRLPKLRQINTQLIMLVSLCCFLILSVEPTVNGFAVDYLGSRGVFTALVVAFVAPNIFRFFVKRGFTIKMPEEVPSFVAQYFANIVPIGVTIAFFWLFGLAFWDSTGIIFGAWIFDLVQPIFDFTNGYIGAALVYGMMAMFFFVSVHGPAVIEPLVAAFFVANIDANLRIFMEGGHATAVLTHSTSHFIATAGGTGATMMFCLMCALTARSKQLRSVGRGSWVPGIFNVNEPVVFGTPMAMNSLFLAPFVLTPVINVCLLKYFVEELGMNSFMYILPWTTPAPLGLILGTGLDKMSFILALVLLVVDALTYLPFFIIHDRRLARAEAVAAENAEEIREEAAKRFELSDSTKPRNILAMCASGATSSMLAKTINNGARQYNLPIHATSIGYGQHRSMIKDFDLVILAPQMASMFDELKHECDIKGVTAVTTSGVEYVAITREPDKALEFVINLINE